MQLCGRRLYETMLYWETAQETSLPEEHVEFARIWKALPKVVFSTTLESVVGNTRLATEGVGEEVARLKEQPGKDIAVGGAGLARACMELGLIDEWRLFVSPVLLGGGTPYFPPLDETVKPGVGRDADVWRSRRLPSLPARVERPLDGPATLGSWSRGDIRRGRRLAAGVGKHGGREIHDGDRATQCPDQGFAAGDDGAAE